MLVKTEAIVLHALKYGESKVIADLFTRETGRMSVIVLLGRTQRSRFKKQYFQPLTLLEVECDLRPRQQLQQLRDARQLVPYATIPFSPEKLALALFTAEFLYHALRSEQRNTPMFDYIRDSVMWLDMAGEGFANFHLTFLMRMSKFLGFFPNLDEGLSRKDCRGGTVEEGGATVEEGRGTVEEGGRRKEEVGRAFGLMFDLREGCFTDVVPTHRDFLSPDDARHIQTLMRMDFPTMRLFKLSRHERNRITSVLIDYYRLHIPQFPEMKSLSVLQELWG